MKRPAILALALVALLAVGGGAYFWHKHKTDVTQPPKGPQAVEVVTLETRRVMSSISAVGSLLAGESAEIHPEIAGQIDSIQFSEGQAVKAGDVLVKMDSSLIETELAKANAALGVASAIFQREDKLKKTGFIATQQWDTSRADMQSAQAAADNARIQLEKTSIKAPFDGIAGLRDFSPGDYAEVGKMLTSVVSLNPLKIEFSVPEKNYAAIHPDQEITFSVDAFPGEKFKGTIYAIDPRINVENRNFTVKANIPNPDMRLRPGMYARIDVVTTARDNVVMVPEEAIVPQGDDSYVFLYDNGKASYRKISLGIRQTGFVEATDGVKAGDRVITAGLLKLKDGAPVKEVAKTKDIPADVEPQVDPTATPAPKTAAPADSNAPAGK